MKADLAARLRRIMRGETIEQDAATGVAGVTGVSGYAAKPLALRKLRRLRPENSNSEKRDFQVVFPGVTALPESDEDEILERARLCADSVPAIYLDTWARLNHQKPLLVSEEEWRQALDDGGRFLDAWGWVSECEWAWAANALFAVPDSGRSGGLIWSLRGALVEAYGPDHVRLRDGRVIERRQIGDGDEKD